MLLWPARGGRRGRAGAGIVGVGERFGVLNCRCLGSVAARLHCVVVFYSFYSDPWRQ